MTAKRIVYTAAGIFQLFLGESGRRREYQIAVFRVIRHDMEVTIIRKSDSDLLGYHGLRVSEQAGAELLAGLCFLRRRR